MKKKAKKTHEKIIVKKRKKTHEKRKGKKGENMVFVVNKKNKKNMLEKNFSEWFEKIVQEKDTVYKKTSRSLFMKNIYYH